ncbi:MAG: RNA polymerase sigma factor [Verrucomicrobia bacterium]|nr:RNA polymerase sigma factor [Verrucomicrobiota bacterium]
MTGPGISMVRPDREDFGRFYRATVAPLRRFLGRMTRNGEDARDLSHDAYARVYQAMARQQVEKPQAYLFTTARRLALKQIRRQKVNPVRPTEGDVIEFAVSEAPGVERQVMARQEWARVEAAIGELPPGCRSVLQLSHRDGLSHREIGARLEIAVSTVEKQHARALRLLRASLQADAPRLRGAGTSNQSQEGGPRAATP